MFPVCGILFSPKSPCTSFLPLQAQEHSAALLQHLQAEQREEERRGEEGRGGGEGSGGEGRGGEGRGGEERSEVGRRKDE